jgi:iron complex outermembrane recepter protein
MSMPAALAREQGDEAVNKKTERAGETGLLNSDGGRRKAFWSQTSALIGAAAVAALLPQSAAAQQQQPAPAAQADEQGEDDADDEIVVTGSRIRTEFSSTSPLQVIDAEAATLAGVSDAADVLQNSSIAAGSPQIDATISSAFVTDGGPGAQTISLRGLGANRTLVLLNGRRAGPAGSRGAVSAFDLNVVPVGVIDRIEILKDGASSVYGSDAVAGVVNIITSREMDGGSASFNYSMPQEEGGEELAAELSWGRRFDRGYFNVSANYYEQSETLAGSRSYTNCGVETSWDATALPALRRNDVIDPRTGQPACRGNTATGLVWVYDYSGENTLQGGFGPNFIQYDPTGRVGTANPGSLIPAPANPNQVGAPANWYQVGYDRLSSGVTDTNSPFEQNSSVIPSSERATVFLEGGFEISDSVEAYAEVLLNRRETASNGFRQVWTYLYSYDLGDPFSIGWTGINTNSPTPTTDHADASQQVDYTRAVAGLRGDFAGWLGTIDWDIYGQYSKSDATYTNDRILQDAVYSSDGRSDFGTVGLIKPNSIPRPTASCVGFNTPISNRPCIDVNWLSPTLMTGGGFTAAEEAFLYDVETGTTEYTQSFIEGSIGGDLFALPAGNVAGVLGFVWREDEILDTPGHVTLAGNAWGSSASGVTRGQDTTREFFAELAAPIVDGSALGDLNLTLSGRATDVESSGEATTYKIGLGWQVTPEFLLRFSRGTSFRAPALFELFLNGETSFPGQRAIDPCINWGAALASGRISQRIADNCAAEGIPNNYAGAGSSATAFRSGGLGLLEPETSEATVVGFSWSPADVNFRVSVDYFDIEVKDEVATLGAAAVVRGCYDSVNFPTDPLCTLFNRIGTGGNPFLIDRVDNSFLNINDQRNRGIDLTARYVHDLPFGELSLQTQLTWQLEDKVELFSGTVRDDNGINGDPNVVGNFDATLKSGPWTYFWRTQFIGATSDRSIVDEVQDIEGGPEPDVRYDIVGEAAYYHTASIRREFDRVHLTFGVANIFDQEPPVVTPLQAANQTVIGPSLLSSQYDYLGRRAFIRVSADF